MTYSSETVKAILQTFVEENYDASFYVGKSKKEHVLANMAIFDVESYLIELRTELKINARFDTSIVSKNILSNFSDSSAANAYRHVDYQYNFLYYLAEEYRFGTELFDLIDSFIEKFKHQLTLSDIVITSSGATRCKTNIRFALSELRDLGLVLSKNKEGKRLWGPSILGLVALLNTKFDTDRERWPYYKHPASLLVAHGPGNMLPSFFVYDPVLIRSLKMFEDPTHLYVFLNTQLGFALTENEKKLLRQILEDFINFTHEGLVIDSKGIKITKEFSRLSKHFQKELFSLEDGNEQLHGKLFRHFRDGQK